MSRWLDIDNILWEEEKVSCTFKIGCNQIGFLDPNHHRGNSGRNIDDDDEYSDSSSSSSSSSSLARLQEGSRISLPLYLAIDLAKKRFICDLEVPKFLGPKMRQAIDAGAGSISIREFSYYFFEVGMELAKYLAKSEVMKRKEEADNICKALRKAFFGDRYEKLFTYALTGGHHDTTEFVQTLTAAEQSVFRLGHSAYKAQSEWKASPVVLLKPSAAVTNNNKRNRDSNSSSNSSINSSSSSGGGGSTAHSDSASEKRSRNP